MEKKSLNKGMDKEGARGLTCLWNGFVSINGKKELMLTGRRKRWTLEGWGREVTDGKSVSAQSEMVMK